MRPSTTRIKICGVRRAEDVEAAVRSGAAAIGLVFVEASPRSVGVDQARELVSRIPPFVDAVGLFVDASAEDVLQTASSTGLRTVQLHGHEPIDMVEPLREASLRIIKALPADDQLVERVSHWSSRVDALLIDTPPAMGGLTGGSGEQFDWTAFSDLDATKRPPLILAGGLTPENVGQAIEQTRPFAVDVSSGVESERGVKDADAIARFCRAVRTADARLADQSSS